MNGGEGNGSPGFFARHKKGAIAGFIVGALLVYVISGGPPFDGGSSNERTRLNFPAGGPAEFLYLDRARVVAYLAQIVGGTFASEQQSSKLSDTAESRLTLKEIAEFGASETQERTFARVVTPTAAAEYFELLFDLEHEPGLPGGPDGVEEIGLGNFAGDVADLPEGQFVSFRTHGLRPPVYLNPYLAARQRTTMQTLFPPPSRAQVAPIRAHRQRERVRHFRRQLGRNPRVTFKLRPLYPAEAATIRKRHRAERKARREGPAAAVGPGAVGAAGAPGGLPATSSPPVPELAASVRRQSTCRRARHRRKMRGQTAKERIERQHAVYLMPLDARRLTRERSLVKYGGGDFTVVGKVVRVFPESGDGLSPAYVDSSTRETWEQPLTHAPLRLLCGTDPDCRELARQDGPNKAEAEIRESRCSDLEALREQTEISLRGAVILPIAIYK
jgi:hypothetical protein